MSGDGDKSWGCPVGFQVKAALCPCLVGKAMCSHVDGNAVLGCLLSCCLPCCFQCYIGPKIYAKSGVEDSCIKACMKGTCCTVCYYYAVLAEYRKQTQDQVFGRSSRQELMLPIKQVLYSACCGCCLMGDIRADTGGRWTLGCLGCACCPPCTLCHASRRLAQKEHIPLGRCKAFCCSLCCTVCWARTVCWEYYYALNSEERQPLEGGGLCPCCRKRHGDAATPSSPSSPARPPKNKKGKADPAVDRIAVKFFEAFDLSVEEAVKTYLEGELLADYEAAFAALAVGERVAAWRIMERTRKVANKEVPQPDEPTLPNPLEMFRDGPYSDFDTTGFPQADADGKPLDKKTAARLRKDHQVCTKAWSKFNEDKQKWADYILYKARREQMEEGVEIQYPEEVDHLRPISSKSQRPFKVILTKIPGDQARAFWTDELKQITAEGVDPRCRKDKKLVKTFAGLTDRCLSSVKGEVVTKLMALSQNDKAIWEGVSVVAVSNGKEPTPPAEPKGLVDPAELFKSGKNADKYELDDEGMATKKTGGEEMSDKEMAPLRKQWEAAKAAWDKHKQAVAQYEDELELFKAAEAGDGAAEGEIPLAQKQKTCEAAGSVVVEKLIDKVILERGADIAAQVNAGNKDPEELSALMVRQTLEEEEIITDPVLKAIRRFDEAQTNTIILTRLRELFDAMGEDELQTETHRFYAEISDVELDWVKGQLGDLGLDEDGQMTYLDFKSFIESQDIETAAGRAPSNLVSCLMTRRMDDWLNRSEVTSLWNPRSWRRRLEELHAMQDEQSRSPRREKKDKKEKKSKGDEAADEEEDDTKDKKDVKNKKDKKEKTEDEEGEGDGGKKHKKERKDKTEDEEGEGDGVKKERKEKKDKKNKKEESAEPEDKEKKERKDKKDKKEEVADEDDKKDKKDKKEKKTKTK